MPDLPIHKVVQQSRYGVFAKEISALLSPSAVGMLIGMTTIYSEWLKKERVG